tara:strand:- start:2890 stop:3522 length:633 start_codon:yes stop_codon:yes gene_type:complete
MTASADELLAKAGAIMYDCEIYRAIYMHGEFRDPKLQYCGGWTDYEGMGVSVITAYDFVMSEWGVYMSDNLKDFKTLINSRNIVMGFNSKRFDDNLIRANGIPLDPDKGYDLWKQIVDTQLPGQRKGFRLSDMLEANDIPAKTDMGSDAPRQAQQGEWGRLISYGINDSLKQVQLLRKAINGTMKNPKNGEYMTIKLPWEVVKVEMDGLF